jgi:EAL domain-containing protein (putative c-di-GMP-specific phosphodiesterase class I)
LRVVAEGAESAEDWSALIGYGCDEVQGELLSGPLPIDELRAWLDRRREGERLSPRF